MKEFEPLINMDQQLRERRELLNKYKGMFAIFTGSIKYRGRWAYIVDTGISNPDDYPYAILNPINLKDVNSAIWDGYQRSLKSLVIVREISQEDLEAGAKECRRLRNLFNDRHTDIDSWRLEEANCFAKKNSKAKSSIVYKYEKITL